VFAFVFACKKFVMPTTWLRDLCFGLMGKLSAFPTGIPLLRSRGSAGIVIVSIGVAHENTKTAYRLFERQ
jgi:hypothetical protein